MMLYYSNFLFLCFWEYLDLEIIPIPIQETVRSYQVKLQTLRNDWMKQ